MRRFTVGDSGRSEQFPAILPPPSAIWIHDNFGPFGRTNRAARVREPVRSEQLLQHTGVEEGLQRRIERAAVNDHVSLERMFGDRVFNGRPCGVEAGPEAPLQSDFR